MRACSWGSRWFVVVAIAVASCVAAPAAGAATFVSLPGFNDPATPDPLDKVGVLKEGPADAKKILILLPGTSGGAGYLDPLAQDVVSQAKGWQVWSVERRENVFEDHTMADRLKRGEATAQQFFDYYLGWLTNPAVTEHFPLSLGGPAFARGWGMRIAVEDVKQVVAEARKQSRQVVLAGHSLGGSIATAYATWDFDGKVGGDDLSGLVLVDGGSGPATLTAQGATDALQGLQTGSPWLTFGGIPPPFAGLFNIVGSGLAKVAPNSRSILQGWPLLPPFLSSPVIATNEAAYGFSLDTETSPSALVAAQVHAGKLAQGDEPVGWDNAGELSPIQRVADMFFGTGLPGVDGTAWFHPRRLTVDAGAVGAGIANPAQPVLDVRSIHGRDVGHLSIYAFGAALGGQRVLDAGQLLATQSGIPARRVTLVDGSATYAHVDPLAAHPRNAFLDHLLPFLKKTKKVKQDKRAKG
jgi:pimeloyl-ACP methyl ester carboxylesterase